MPTLHLPTDDRFSVAARFDGDEQILMRFATSAQQHEPLSQRRVMNLWQHDEGFREFFSAVLSAAPFEAFKWETPPIVRACDPAFECVVISSPALARVAADPSSFEKHIAGGAGSCEVVAFANLGGDAHLIVPCESMPDANFAHLATFLRTAPRAQIHKLWQAVSTSLTGVIDSKVWEPIWVSTAGLGVSWLHIRIDSRPKYYGYGPFKLAA